MISINVLVLVCLNEHMCKLAPLNKETKISDKLASNDVLNSQAKLEFSDISIIFICCLITGITYSSFK